MKHRVEIGARAETDLEEIWAYIAADDILSASRFVDQIEVEVKRLATFPEKFPFIPESELLGYHYRHLLVGDYRVVYRVEAEKVFILRVLHGARLLGADMLDEYE